GMVYIPKLSSPGVGLVLRGGLTLPTGSDDNDDALVNLITTFLRPTDLWVQLPRSSSLRLAVSPVFRSGTFFGRIDAGVDLNVYRDTGDKIDPAVLLNFGAGVDLGTVALMGEISISAVTGDNGESVSSGALSIRGTAGGVQPYGAVLIPIDDDVKGIFDLGLLLGLEARL